MSTLSSIGLKNPDWDLNKSRCEYLVTLLTLVQNVYSQQTTLVRNNRDDTLQKIALTLKHDEIPTRPYNLTLCACLLPDDVINSYLLMDSPGPVLMILAVYLLFVLKLGPAFMQKRQAFQLKHSLLIYNIVQVVGSAYLVYTVREM